jgi:hypothetical protein
MDRTYLAVRRQLQGMNCQEYEIGIRDATSGKMMSRQWSPEEVLKSVLFLKGMNSKGNDIYIRPLKSEGLLLVDDLGIGTLNQMDEDGLNPAAIIQTSPMNYQAWVRITTEELPAEIATTAAKILAEKYQADKNSADWRHYGRLAGFTNLKPIYNRPYVLAERCNGKLAPQREQLLEQARKTLQDAKNTQLATTLAAPSVNPIRKPSTEQIDPIQYATQQYQKLAQKYHQNFDISKADYLVACDLIKLGMKDTDIQATMNQTSPNLDKRKTGHIEDYLTRTIAAAHRRMQQTR